MATIRNRSCKRDKPPLLKRLCALIAVVVCFGALTLQAAAQPAADGPRGDKGAAAARKKFNKLRKRVLRRKVGLSEAKAERVEQIIKKHVVERRKLQGQMRQARKALRKLFKADSDDQQAYAAAIAKMRSSHNAMARIQEGQFAELEKVLTPKEQAKLLRALNQVRRHMRQRRAAAAKERQARRKKRGRNKRGPRRKRRQPKRP